MLIGKCAYWFAKIAYIIMCIRKAPKFRLKIHSRMNVVNKISSSNLLIEYLYRYTGVRFYPPFFRYNLTSGMLMVGCVHFFEIFFIWRGVKELFMLSAPSRLAQNERTRCPGLRGMSPPVVQGSTECLPPIVRIETKNIS